MSDWDKVAAQLRSEGKLGKRGKGKGKRGSTAKLRRAPRGSSDALLHERKRKLAARRRRAKG